MITLTCSQCSASFIRKSNRVIYDEKHGINRFRFCSKKCKSDSQLRAQQVSCLQCQNIFTKTLAACQTSPNHFCTKSCAAKYNNTHKTKGNRRSKLEVWLETKLTTLYPNLEFLWNQKETINSELDIYIPSMKLAIELNGIFHYEPIYGTEKLASIQNNDERKSQACSVKDIELLIIDTSSLKYFKEVNATPFLEIIQNVINKKLLRHDSDVK